MKNLLNRFEDYLQKTLEVQGETLTWAGAKQLPILFRDRYDFYTCKLLNTKLLLMLTKSEKEDTPATIKKHADKVMTFSGCEAIYIRETMAAHNRQRLIKHKVSFVVPGNQMYLPVLGIDLQEHIRNIRKPAEQTFSPATQAAVLHTIYFGVGIGNYVTPLELSNLLNYTKMTLTRVVDELEAASLVEVETKWKERRFRFPMSKKELWEKARPFMRSPVKRIVTTTKQPEIIDCDVAGESALSEYTMLAPTQHQTYAMTTDMWKNIFPDRRDEPKHVPEDEAVTVEIWNYIPLNAGIANCVDPLSLLLSIGDTTDERLEAALQELEEDEQWW